MLRKLVLLLAALFVTMSTAFAGPVDVNTADQATLQTLKGIGPVKSKAIVDERTAHGPFKNADDLARRVTGLGMKSVTKLEAEGLTIGGSSAPPTGAGAGAGAKQEKAPAAMAPALAASEPRRKWGLRALPSQAASSSSASAASNAQATQSKKKKKDKTKAGSAASGT
ncbi:ComEA family DNA-binding protein [Trinickia sp.]|uniref:ComEA family DNA-binding protein n=1 Tax=Trinickia sp. TaxID=2571163 RepID=UPI003F81A651